MKRAEKDTIKKCETEKMLAQSKIACEHDVHKQFSRLKTFQKINIKHGKDIHISRIVMSSQKEKKKFCILQL